jgi:hypothetical protein
MKKHLLGALALLAAAGAHAQSSNVHGFVGMAITGGGKTLVTVQYSDGSSHNITSGGLVDLKGGFEYRQSGSPLSIQASVGYHVDNTSASNGSVRFSRFPVELLGFWNANEKFRVGGGLRVATGAKLSGSGAASNLGSTSLGSNAGVVVEGEYFFAPQVGATLRWVDEKYTLPNGAGKVDGSHVGVRLNYYF